MGAGASVAQGGATPDTSALDAPLLYQLLIGEIELGSGRAGTAYEVFLDAARRTHDDDLFKRAIDVALQAHAGDQALTAAAAWRAAKPAATEARRYQIQILFALARLGEAVEPVTGWIDAAPAAERPAMIATLPRWLQRTGDHRKNAAAFELLMLPYRDQPATRTAARVAIGRAWLSAGDSDRVLELARSAQADDPAAIEPVLLALELPKLSDAEALVKRYLALPGAKPEVRQAYARELAQAQRFSDSVAQVELVTQDNPKLAQPWLSLGALRLELHQPKAAEVALLRYLELIAGTPLAADIDDSSDAPGGHPVGGQNQAWLLLAQTAELQGDLARAAEWLAKVDQPQRALEVLTRRASLLARQGKIKAAHDLLHRDAEQNADDAKARLLAEAQVMRDVKRWAEAREALVEANLRFPDDVDLLYEQAMVEEKLDHNVEMERLLRRTIALKPDHAQSYNALGYSLADRRERLPEAQSLIRRALDLTPDDPFITDSLGWVEFRLGNRAEALRLLRQAYAARPDAEIAAHLGEVLWADAKRDEAMRIWREGRGRDADNEVLQETLKRLKVSL
jgi:tetratricopeptide (TPR) repeat protein